MCTNPLLTLLAPAMPPHLHPALQGLATCTFHIANTSVSCRRSQRSAVWRRVRELPGARGQDSEPPARLIPWLSLYAGLPTSSPLTLRGCATKSVCVLKKDFTVYFGLYTYVTSTVNTCTPATKAGKSASWIPGPNPFAVFLLSLLLLKYLS